ncbi:MAG: nodulation protein NfeD [Thiohalorhabdus sp.]|uniref:NfeD family protein n=1 Tax=Thiohalorhabdus sp. TaxID=3094134 RepID=UPI002FC31C70
MKVRWLIYLGLVLIGAAGVLNAQTEDPASGSETDSPRVVLADVNGVIGPAQADWVDQVLSRAGERGAAAVMLRLDTPGGLTSSMRTIIQSILSSPVPVIGWVGPSGSRAASAGTYILYACHVAAMAPGTNLGAATPVQMGGGLPGSEEPDTEKENGSEANGREAPANAKERKAVEDAVAYIRSLAEMRGRNADWAERAVREAASLSAEQAAADNVIDFVAASEQAVLAQANGRRVDTGAGTVTLALEGAVTESMAPGWRTRLLQVLANPNVAYILMLIGIYGLIFELANPGAIVPGVIGGISLLLALYAFQTLPVNFAGLALIGLAILFFVGEAVVPSFGALGVGGLIAFVLGSVLLMDTDVPALEIAWPVIVTASLVTGAFILAVATMAAKGHRRQPVSGSGHLVGRTAEAVEDLDPEGRVRFEGELWRARASRPAAKGDTVRIDALNGLTLAVSPIEDSAQSEE